MTMLLGKKIGMTQVYDATGNLLPVTVIQAGPCTVMQVKTADRDGYSSVQIGFDDVKASRRTQAMVGHAKKADADPKKFVREERLADGQAQPAAGDVMKVDVFTEAQWVDVVGTSKGKGFAGVMKRHNFGGFPGSHGTERKHRAPGSIGSYASDRGHGGNLKKGKRMAGHMGHERITSKNHKIVSIDIENNLLVVKGSVPGPNGGYVVVKSVK